MKFPENLLILFLIAAALVGILALYMAPFYLGRKRGGDRFIYIALATFLLTPLAGPIVALAPDKSNPLTEPEAGQLGCPACGHAYAAADYRDDAPVWECSRCAAELPKPGV